MILEVFGHLRNKIIRMSEPNSQRTYSILTNHQQKLKFLYEIDITVK
jgi:hypothetical protein